MCALILVRWSHSMFRARCIALSDPWQQCVCVWISCRHLYAPSVTSRADACHSPFCRTSHELSQDIWYCLLLLLLLFGSSSMDMDGYNVCVPHRRIRWISKYLGFLCYIREFAWLVTAVGGRRWCRRHCRQQQFIQIHEMHKCVGQCFRFVPISLRRTTAVCLWCLLMLWLERNGIRNIFIFFDRVVFAVVVAAGEWVGRNGWTHSAATQHNDCTFMCE